MPAAVAVRDTVVEVQAAPPSKTDPVPVRPGAATWIAMRGTNSRVCETDTGAPGAATVKVIGSVKALIQSNRL